MSRLVDDAPGMSPGAEIRMQLGPHLCYDVRLESRAARCSMGNDAYLLFSDLGDIRRRLAIFRRLADTGNEERLSRLIPQLFSANT